MKGRNAELGNASIPRRLRTTMTDAERALWRRLRGQQLAGCKFRRQHPFARFVLDFVCLERKLVVEVDGSQHFESEADRLRDRCLENAGFRVLRFWNNQVLNEIDAVVEAIGLALGVVEPHPHPGPPLEGAGASRPLRAARLHPHSGPPLEGEGVEAPC